MLTKVKSDITYGAIVADESDCYRCCGIQYKNWILTSGLILCPCISAEDLELNEFDNDAGFGNCNRNHLELSNINIKLLLKNIMGKPFKVTSTAGKNMILNNKNASTYVDSSRSKRESHLISTIAYPAGIFRSDLIKNYISDNFSDWKLCFTQEQNQNTSSDILQYLLSVLFLLKVGGDGNEVTDVNHDRTPLSYFLKLCCNKQNVFRGFDIIIESTPFTIPQFYNSWSKGIVSNTVGNMECLFYTDARLVIGCIGAPVYRYDQDTKGDLIGMILNPMLWSQGEWAGFSVAVNLPVVLNELLDYKSPLYNNYKSLTHDLSIKKLIENLDHSIVLVRCGYNWGSGVIVNTKLGVIITCAHVVDYGEKEIVRIECGNYKIKAKVVYSNKAGEVFDIAILSTQPLLRLKEIHFAKDPPVKGETVFCVGYPMVDTDRVTLSKGIIANVVPEILLQTTCCIQSGASGGAVIRPCGSFIGIPVSNMSCATTRALFPHCNMSVPTTGFANLLARYFETEDVSCLKNLSSENSLALQEWSFQNKCRL